MRLSVVTKGGARGVTGRDPKSLHMMEDQRNPKNLMSKPRAIAFASAKGGSGKTVTAVSFARVLNGLGQRVLLVDADVDTSGLTLLFLDEVLDARESLNAASGGLLDREMAFRPCRLSDELFLVPTEYHAEPNRSSSPDLVYDNLRILLAEVYEDFDFILIDAQAGADDVALAVADLADEVVIVTEYDPVSAQGVKRLERKAPHVFDLNKTWVLYNKVLPELVEGIGSLLRVERRLVPVPWDVEVVRAFMESRVPIDMDVPNAYTRSIVASVESLFSRELGDAIRAWRAQTARAVRAPLEDRIGLIESELDEMELARIDLRTAADRGAALRRTSVRLTQGALFLGMAVSAAIGISTAKKIAPWAIVLLGAFVSVALLVFLATAYEASRTTASQRSAILKLTRLEREYEVLAKEREQLVTSLRLDRTDPTGHRDPATDISTDL